MQIHPASVHGITPQRALRTRDAELAGVSRGRLRGPAWQPISYGLHAPTRPDRTLRELAGMTQQVLPRDSGFGHLTSAQLRGWWLPNGFRPPPAPLLFASTTSSVHVQRHGLYVRRSRHTEVDDVDGLPVVTAAETLVELARDLSLVDLVPLVDCALARGASPVAILAAARPRARGAGRLRRAVMLSDPRSESWWESVLRLVHVVAGLGPVASQVEITRCGVFVARADLHLVGTDRYPECDGGEHRTVDRHADDLRRDRRMHEAGAERYGYPTADIALRPETVIRDAESARGLAHDPARAAAWWQVARSSTLTAHGRARLAGRLRRYHAAATR